MQFDRLAILAVGAIVGLSVGCFSTNVRVPRNDDDPFKGTTLDPNSAPVNEAPPPKNPQDPDMDYIKDMLRRSADQGAKCDNKEIKGPRDIAHVEVVFTPNGRVDKVTVRPPHEGTPMGNCLARAFEGIFVTDWQGSESVTLEQPIDFSKKKQEALP